MKHIIFFSGGIGSWAVAEIVKKREGITNLQCLFTDTLIEDNDLYRFMLETWAIIFEKEKPVALIERAKALTLVEDDMDKRKEELEVLRIDANEYFGGKVVWLSYQKGPWDIYFESRFLGNSRLAKCSHVLKQDMAREWIVANTDENDTTLYLGIDWTESHRMKAPRENWAPRKVEFPLGDEDMFISKNELFWKLDESGVEIPELYKLSFSHNNCGGFCCKAGQGHFYNLLKTKPKLFAYHEQKERELREYLGKDVAMMKKTVNKQVQPLTMEKLRLLYETGKEEAIDKCDIGGCGCFVTAE